MRSPWALVISLAVALAWVPVLLKFFRSWRERANPISLAICILISTAIYLPVYTAVALPLCWPVATIIVVGGVACVSFYLALWAARKRFRDIRSRRN